ncbi:hypothetical protein TraAM80_07144 [Trypanosoma rangeli]|uniref:Uncharacterized protein n=1 Tax=Trypanosoma rangeli TaxID=5698 RepID=A0A422N6Z1_TRYRA|nr:uncharacterized protein TraAM80_07144 [Trypanosoma rangeli]RNF01206.1 hypothetical protein TraAM80_07144 [Trypanosoma rangeli]|eukprot:RNF01206.1 hypothetical protein TraAM80_07144 [Trypanosoma rangeli]
MGKGGARALQDEKVLLAELGKLFHMARANVREQRNTQRAEAKRQKAPTTTAARAKRTAAAGAKGGNLTEGRPPRTGSKRSRKSTRGGTVWVVLKGGFTRVPTSEKAQAIAHNTAFRGRLSERRRVQALERAEEYIQTAWQQAQEAGLLLDDGSGPNGDEGLQYLREQYEVAAGMLRREPVGAFLKKIVAQTIPSYATVPAEATTPAAASLASAAAPMLLTRDEWADVIARETLILKRFAPSTSTEEDTGEAVLHEAAQVPSRYYFPIAEPLAPLEAALAETTVGYRDTGSDAPGGEQARDVLPTKCIVRIRGSGKQKHTAILASTKAVNYLKSNLMQVIRKELSGSKLPRGEDVVEGKLHQPHQQQASHGAVAENAAMGSSKKNSRRRHK